MSHERIARIANGTLIVAACLASYYDRGSVWLIVLMGISLIFSGAVDFCGFKVMLKRLENFKNRSQ